MENLNLEYYLSEFGMEKNEIKIYLESLKIGSSAASILAKRANIPRTTARYACESLVNKGIMTESKKGNAKIFTSEHPSKLKNLVKIEKNKLEEKEKRIDYIMRDLINLQNPYSSMPKVTYYEGIDGIKKILFESLNAKEIVDAFTDTESFIKNASEINEEYAKKRLKLGLKRRSIYSDVNQTKKYINDLYKNKKDELNYIKFINPDKFNLNASVIIYDGKVSYMITKRGEFFGVIIENQNIYDFHKKMFNFIWNIL